MLREFIDELREENRLQRSQVPQRAQPQLRPPKLEVYDLSTKETNVRLWLFDLNNYFRTVGYEDAGAANKISFVVNLLKGATLEWWR
jgi:hypothetical protein